MGKKPRSDSTLDSLPPEQKKQLRGWLVDENMAYDKAVERVFAEFGIHTSVSALSRFYASDCFLFRSNQAEEASNRVLQKLASSGSQLGEATIAMVRQLAFEEAMVKGRDPDALAIFCKIANDAAKLELKRQELVLQERRIKLLEEKAKQADQAREISQNPAMTAAEKEDAMKAVFGIR